MMNILGGGLVRSNGRVCWDELSRVVAFALNDMVDREVVIEDLFEMLSEGWYDEIYEFYPCDEFDEYIQANNDYRSGKTKDIPEEIIKARDNELFDCIYDIIDNIMSEHYGYVYSLPFDIKDKLMPNFDEEEFLTHFDDKNSDDEILLDDLRDYLESLFSEEEVTNAAIEICEDRVPAYFE